MNKKAKTLKSLQKHLNRRDFLKLAGISGAAVCGSTLFGRSPAVHSASKTIKIGVCMGFTGLAADIYTEASRGVEIAHEEIGGKINGINIELIKSDTPDVKAAMSEVTRLINIKDADIIIGPGPCGLAESVSALCERSKVIQWLIMCGQGYGILQGGLEYVFRPIPYAAQEGYMMADWLCQDLLPRIGKKPKESRIALVMDETPFGVDKFKAFQAKQKEFGFQLPVVEAYPRGAKDFSSIVLKAKNANIDAYVRSGSGQDAVNNLRDMKAINLAPPIIMGTGGGIGTGYCAKAMGDEINYILSSNWAPEETPVSVAPGIPKFVGLYRKKFNRDHIYSCHSLSSYTATLILWDILKRAGARDREGILQAARETDIPKFKIGNGWGAKFSSKAEPLEGMVNQNVRAFTVGTQWQERKIWTVYPQPYPGRETKLPFPGWKS
jgi:branched-chain amino acid transport system substrate-binding protein